MFVLCLAYLSPPLPLQRGAFVCLLFKPPLPLQRRGIYPHSTIYNLSLTIYHLPLTIYH